MRHGSTVQGKGAHGGKRLVGHKGKRRASKEVHVSSLKKKQDSSGDLYHRRSLPLSIQYLAGFTPVGLLFIFRATKQITPNVHHPLLSAKHHWWTTDPCSLLLFICLLLRGLLQPRQSLQKVQQESGKVVETLSSKILETKSDKTLSRLSLKGSWIRHPMEFPSN